MTKIKLKYYVNSKPIILNLKLIILNKYIYNLFKNVL